MRALLAVVLCWSFLSTSCTLLGYYKYRKPDRALPEEAESVRFPDSYKEGVHLDGPTMAALEVAMNEFMPPGSKAKVDSHEQLARCLSQRDTYDVSVLKASDDLFFVYFSPVLSRCGIEEDEIVFDIDATYAVDGRGRILDVR